MLSITYPLMNAGSALVVTILKLLLDVLLVVAPKLSIALTLHQQSLSLF
ncbi:MAG: hypothetical protein PHU01_15150 [Desulfuromonadaceae bacterium]|nr:hypothetical protein [Desulfuromonadaceae bacterium]